ncbi:AfsR/SARP family transcriptional regulator [Deinococcus aestuarii]|uniref:AfsR/SARP family transcriptional regulator n=1 Tax=Deinococcus aestuarii TaxID=2774531 RepID=UPI001C0B67AB|nr:BTAD domain-containing putative transcriptional regulator [Deinococcus aestuarii]
MTAPAPISAALFLHTLGDSVVTLDGQPLTWPAHSAEELLWYLHAHEGGAYRADVLAELWGLEDTPAAANRFRVALCRLRATLGSADAVTEVRGRYALHPAILAQSDTAALHAGLLGARFARDDAEREEALRRALAVADGDYLPGVRGDWADAARAHHRAARVRAYVALATLHCARRECPLAALALTRAVECDPLIGEDHHQRLMTCLAATRGKYEAVEHYRRYCRYLREEVGDTPMSETACLAERIKQGEVPCADTMLAAPATGSLPFLGR